MNNVAFTSDSHGFHANIIKYCNRPFADEVSMTETLAKNINAAVNKNGTLYHLGDWAFGGLEKCVEFREMVRPDINIVLILGNHDTHHMKHERFTNLFHDIHDMLEKKVEGQRVIMCHYAMRTWAKMQYGSFHLYGHSHGSLPDDPHSRSFDIGVDCHGYRPLSFAEVSDIMSRKKWQPIDHHTGER